VFPRSERREENTNTLGLETAYLRAAAGDGLGGLLHRQQVGLGAVASQNSV
jgi:hypothetical protein